jgi:hypothetical protein
VNPFKRSGTGLFASASVIAHLLRGMVGVGLLIYVSHNEVRPLLLILAVLAALLAFRGCPMCWTIGLIETLIRKRGGP